MARNRVPFSIYPPSPKMQRLFTPSYCLMLAANFLMFFGFWMLVPVLPFYLAEIFKAEGTLIGIILSCYTVSALCIRPFSGYLIDMFARKPLYLTAYAVFTFIFAGYKFAGTLLLFSLFRVAHGLAFGTTSVGGSTIVIDILPSERRGEGLGYFGLTNNFAMSIGPMLGLMLHGLVSYDIIFAIAFAATLVGLIAAALVKTPLKPRVVREPLSFDRFILKRGIPAGITLLLMSIPYGMTTNYVALYAQQMALDVNTGLFFTFMAVGMAISRIFSGRLVDRGRLTQLIAWGMYVVLVCFALLAACRYFILWNVVVCTYIFFATALLMGIGFGTMFPAYNTLFVNLAPNSKRGTATSTYLTSWDVGIGIGMLIGGYIAEVSSLSYGYLFGALLTLGSLFYYNRVVAPHFLKHKLR